MSLHDEINLYINDLQALLTESNEKTLLKNAREQWGEEDGRYEVLEEFVNSPPSSRFNKPADPPATESGGNDSTPTNKPIR
jgi:hypothetical protein